MGALAVPLYIGIGIFQMAAIMAGLEDWLGLHWFFAIFLAFPIAYIPVIGAVLGVAGAVTAWGWEWWQAGLLFFGAFALSLALGAGATLLEQFRSRGSDA